MAGLLLTANTPRESAHPALQFLEALDSREDAVFNIETYEDKPKGDNSQKNPALQKRWNSITRHDVENILTELNGLNAAGAGVFIAANECKGPRSKNTVSRVRGGHGDFDHDGKNSLKGASHSLKPTIVVQTSPGHYQGYWLAEPDQTMTVAEVEGVNKAIVAHHGADKAAVDASRLLRLPGFKHMKYRAQGETPLVEFRVSGERVTAAQLKEAFPPIKTQPVGKSGTTVTIPSAEPSTPVDFERIAKLVEQAEPGLWVGWSALPKDVDRSVIDMRMACEIARVARVCGVSDGALPKVIEAVFNLSGLVRDKWTDRADYRNRTITEAIKQVANEPVPSLLDFNLNATRESHGDSENRIHLNLSDGLITLSDIPPPPREFVWEDLLPAGKAALLAGAGGVSKTQLALQLMVSVAAGTGLFSRKVMVGSTLGIFAEDDQEELARRINAIINTLNLSPQQKKSVAKRLRALSMVGLDARFTKPISGAIESTGFADEIVRLAEELAAETGEPVRLIVIDHASVIHGGDFNSREDVAQTGRLINYIANETGAAVLLLAHTRKGASTKDEEPTADDAAGSAAWSDLVRSVVVIRTMTEKEGQSKGVQPDKRKEYASLTVVKANYAPPSSSIWLHRRSVEGWGVGVLTEVDLKPKPKPLPGCDWKLRERIVDLVKCSPNLTRTKILLHAGRDGDLKVSKGKVTLEVDAMLLAGELVLVEPTVEEKNKGGIKGDTAGFLRVGKEQ